MAFNNLHPGDDFVPAWHIQAMVSVLNDAMAGRTKRLLITVPPRHLKSVTTSVALVAFWLGRDPSIKIMVTSYGAELAAKLGRDTQTVMRSPDYQRLFPDTILNPNRNTALDIQTTQLGHRIGVSLQGATTGQGGDVLIIDDLMKAVDANSPELRQKANEYFEQALYSRLNDKSEGVIIAIQQRLHVEDFAAYLIDKGFHHLNLRAIAEANESFQLSDGLTHHRSAGEPLFPENEPLHVLENMRREMGNATFNAQYQQNPQQPDSNSLRWEHFGTYDGEPDRYEFLLVVQSWDTAYSTAADADYSVCITFGLHRDNLWHVLHVERARLAYPDLKQRLIRLARLWQADHVLVEAASSGLALLSDLKVGPTYPYHRMHGCKCPDGKELRFAAQTDKVAQGLVALPRDACWLAAFRQELLSFPSAAHDDQVDAFSQSPSR